MVMRAQFVFPVLASILILGTLGFSALDQQAHAYHTPTPGSPTIQIIVDTTDGDGSFDFTIHNATNPADRHFVNIPDTFINNQSPPLAVQAASYSVIEFPVPDNWIHNNNESDCTIDGVSHGSTINFNIENGDTVVCTFVNLFVPPTAVCGDGIQDPGEACDDGNQVNTDACTNACQLPVCGDTITSPPETCDDGNTTSGDGCDSSCLIETPFCEENDCDDGISCTVDTCDEDTDSCNNTPDNTFCDDATFCNGLETCDAEIGCQDGTPPVIDDQIACTIDSCEEPNEIVNNPDDSLCPVTSCTVGMCVEGVGCEISDVADGTVCEDTGVCMVGVCTFDEPPKVEICHKNKKTLSINPDSVNDHINDHGDILGPCETEDKQKKPKKSKK